MLLSKESCNAVGACLAWVVPVVTCHCSDHAPPACQHLSMCCPVFFITLILPFCCVFFRVGGVFEGGSGGGEKARALRRELGDLERAERALDNLIHSSSTQLKQLTEQKDNQRYPSKTKRYCPSVCVHARLPPVSFFAWTLIFHFRSVVRSLTLCRARWAM